MADQNEPTIDHAALASARMEVQRRFPGCAVVLLVARPVGIDGGSETGIATNAEAAFGAAMCEIGASRLRGDEVCQMSKN